MPWFLEARDFDRLYEAVVAAGRHVERHGECFFWKDGFGSWDVGPDLMGPEVWVRRRVDLPDTNEVWELTALLDPEICRDPDYFVGVTLQYMASRTPQEARKNEKGEKNKDER
nr:hypothetical protein [uncultured Actinomyces sp.]